MSALSGVVRAGVGRRRVQTVVMMLTTMMAVTASVLAAGLLVASHAPFDTAFAAQRGAHVTAEYDGTKATEGQVAATAHVAGVTDAAGPYPILSISPHVGRNGAGMPVGDLLPPMTIVGRADASGSVDQLRITSGRWATASDEVVLTAVNAPFGIGDAMTFPGLPGKPTLTVVGLATSMTDSADAWVSPTTLAALTGSGHQPAYQMLYRFGSATTDAQISADRAALTAAVPPGSMTAAGSYLKAKLAADKNSATFVPFIVAFGLLGLAMSILIISIVVTGAVSSATRRIGILKSLGFTPDQIARAYVGQALVPATIGTVLGMVLANVLAVPVMGDAASAYNTGALSIAPWVDLSVVGAALAAVAATALIPALRAGRLRTVEAISVGRAPRAGRGRAVRAVIGRLPLPRAVSLGLASPFARPGRSATMVTAVVLGTVGVTFGVGLAMSLNAVQDSLSRKSPGAVVVQAFGPPPAPLPGASSHPLMKVDPSELSALISAQPGTRRSFMTGQTQLSVAGLAGSTDVIAYTGDASWGSYQMIAGSWFNGAGQAVVPSGFLTATGTHLGDTIMLTDNGHQAPVRLVGEAFSLRQLILTDGRSLDGLGAYILPESIQFDIDLKPGTDVPGYLNSLNRRLDPYGITAQPNNGSMSSTVLAMDALATMLALMLVAVAGLGVLNTVVLDTRERIRDFGIYKALGMTPRQTIATVITSVAGIGIVSGLIGAPIGIALHDYVLPRMGEAAGSAIPHADIAVYHPWVLVPLILGGWLMATAGALLPAGWAAKIRTAAALRTE